MNLSHILLTNRNKNKMVRGVRIYEDSKLYDTFSSFVFVDWYDSGTGKENGKVT
jgi:hypothetical protein